MDVKIKGVDQVYNILEGFHVQLSQAVVVAGQVQAAFGVLSVIHFFDFVHVKCHLKQIRATPEMCGW